MRSASIVKQSLSMAAALLICASVFGNDLESKISVDPINTGIGCRPGHDPMVLFPGYCFVPPQNDFDLGTVIPALPCRPNEAPFDAVCEPIGYTPPLGCLTGQTVLGSGMCSSPDGTASQITQCVHGRVNVDGICRLPPADPLCKVGQAQVETQCFDIPAQTVAFPVNSCGFDVSMVGRLLIVKILKCKG